MVFQLGREEPAMSMDSNGKIIFAKHSEIQQANLKNLAGKKSGCHACIHLILSVCLSFS